MSFMADREANLGITNINNNPIKETLALRSVRQGSYDDLWENEEEESRCRRGRGRN